MPGQREESQSVGVVQNVVDILTGPPPPARRPAGAQRPYPRPPTLCRSPRRYDACRSSPSDSYRSSKKSARLVRPIAPLPRTRLPAREALRLARQVVQHALERGKPQAEARGVEKIVGRRRRADSDGGKPAEARHRDARHAALAWTVRTVPGQGIKKGKAELSCRRFRTPTPNPSPQGGGGFCSLCAWRTRWRTGRDVDGPLPLVGVRRTGETRGSPRQGTGWGCKGGGRFRDIGAAAHSHVIRPRLARRDRRHHQPARRGDDQPSRSGLCRAQQAKHGPVQMTRQ